MCGFGGVRKSRAARWNDAAKEAKTLCREWCRAYQEIWRKLHKLSPEKRNHLYALYEREL